MSRLITAEEFFNQDGIMGVVDNGTNIPAALWANYRHPSSEPVEPQGDADGPVTVAFVNQGRWIAVCPFGCGSAQVVAESDRRFYCCGDNGCQNWSVGNMTIPVVWPEAELQAQIEDLLMLRPRVFRNWEPGETLELLDLENETRGMTIEARARFR